MSHGLIIRPSTADEAGLVHTLLHELAVYEKLDGPEFFHLTPAIIARDFYGDTQNIHADLAFLDGHPAGVCLWYRTYASFRAAPGIHLEDLYVRDAYRGKGIGKAFFAHLARVAASLGARRLAWTVLDWNETAIKFYQGMGAAPTEGWTEYRLQGEALKHMAQT